MKVPLKLSLYVYNGDTCKYVLREYAREDIKSINEHPDGGLNVEIRDLNYNHHNGNSEDGTIHGFIFEKEGWEYSILLNDRLYWERLERLDDSFEREYNRLICKLREVKELA